MSADGYYFKVDGMVLGPADHDYLQRLVHGGTIQADTMVRYGELGEWVVASSVAEISLLLEERCSISPPEDSESSGISCAFLIAIIAAFCFGLTFLPSNFPAMFFSEASDGGPAPASGWLVIIAIWIFQPATFLVMVLALIIGFLTSLFNTAKN